MVLGLVKREKQTHGYVVYRELASWQTEQWSKVRPGSIYHALSQLEKEGFLRNTGITKGTGPARTNYEITPAGEVEFMQLVEKALVEYDLDLFSAGLAFMHELPRLRVIELAKQRLEANQEVSMFLGTLPREADPTAPAKHPEIISAFTNFFDSAASWQRDFIKRLERGDYVFANE